MQTFNSVKVIPKDPQKVWFEPTDITKVPKVFQTSLWKTLDFVSPNFNELKQMISCAYPDLPDRLSKAMRVDTLDKKADLESVVGASGCLGAALVAEGIRTVLVTLGSRGVVVVRRGTADDTFFIDGQRVSRESDSIFEISARWYSVSPREHVVSVSGAGDCWAAGFAASALANLPEHRCISTGVAAAYCSLDHYETVPKKLQQLRQSFLSSSPHSDSAPLAKYKDIPTH